MQSYDPNSVQCTFTQNTPLINKYLLSRFPYEKARACDLASLENITFTAENLSVLQKRTALYNKFLRSICTSSQCCYISPMPNSLLTQYTQDNLQETTLSYLSNHLPSRPLWLEMIQPIKTPLTDVAAFFFYHPQQEYQKWKHVVPQKDLLYQATISRLLNEKEWWILDIIDRSGNSILVLRYHKTLKQWKLSSPHLCPFQMCSYTLSSEKTLPYLLPCRQCETTFSSLWRHFSLIYKHIDKQLTPQAKQYFATEKNHTSPAKEVLSSRTLVPTQPAPIKPTIIMNPLLIDRYIKHHKTNKIIEQSHKYLWMHSAWIMVETLRHIADNTFLQIPNSPIYIELEQPRQLHEHYVAAFSFLPSNNQHWVLSAINDQGQTVWLAFYEQSRWTLPRNYLCPEQKCILKENKKNNRYRLCKICQERIDHYTSWLAIALRMIAGDFQEQVERQEPEYVLETTTKTKHNGQDTENKYTLHRYHVIRYYDACKRRSKEIQTTRGSWMSGRPLAENEYEVNSNAIIYVQIQPKGYNKTYRHERYTYVLGTTQHIEPGFRYQPMTIATFKKLKYRQKITHIFASKFEQH